MILIKNKLITWLDPPRKKKEGINVNLCSLDTSAYWGQENEMVAAYTGE